MAIITQQVLGTGNFGNLATAYKKGRRGVPDEVVDYLWSMLEVDRPIILDVGCGTGIPTRQLAERGALVSATDVDAEMIKAASEDRTENISYSIAPAQHQPFPDATFDAVTIFSAFHWFTEAIPEISRVLKPGGTIFIVNKNDDPSFIEQRRSVLKKFIGEEIPNSKKNYSPRQVLETEGFIGISTNHFSTSEFYTLPEMLTYIQSTSVWNLVPAAARTAALIALEKYYSKQLVNNLVERKVEIVVQVGTKARLTNH